MDYSTNTVFLKNLEDPKQPPKQFSFDGVYNVDSITETIYNDVGFPLVESVCEGYNGTVFAYGQTGCGKSFSMAGIRDPPTQRGIIPRSFEHIFEAAATDTDKKFLIRASYLEIYNESIRDLLSSNGKTGLELHEHPDKGVYIENLSWHECKRINDCERLMDDGNKARVTGATLMNATSSRSHSIFTINVEMCQKADGEEKYKMGKLNLVDLAGSERQSKTGATGDRFKEATKINLSLSALGNVISALVDGKSKHIPYRDSKLTRLLQDSLGGNTKTLMVAAVSPAADNYEETLSTLRYANRAKNIKNKPKINEDPKDALLRQLQEEINLLKAQLMAGNLGFVPQVMQQQETRTVVKRQDNRQEIEEEKRKLRDEYEEQINQIKAKYEEERSNKEQLAREMERLKDAYDSKLVDIEAKDVSGEIRPVAASKTKPPRKSKDGNKASRYQEDSADSIKRDNGRDSKIKYQQQNSMEPHETSNQNKRDSGRNSKDSRYNRQSSIDQSDMDSQPRSANQSPVQSRLDATITPTTSSHKQQHTNSPHYQKSESSSEHVGDEQSNGSALHIIANKQQHGKTSFAQNDVLKPITKSKGAHSQQQTAPNDGINQKRAVLQSPANKNSIASKHKAYGGPHVAISLQHQHDVGQLDIEHQFDNPEYNVEQQQQKQSYDVDEDIHHTVDPLKRLQELQEMMVGGEQINNEELKKKRIKIKKHAEERKQYLQEALRNGNDEEFMLRVYDSVQEEVKFKSKLLNKEVERVKFLETEVKDLQTEFEDQREEYLETIRNQERQIKLLAKILQKVQPVISYDCNYHNLDRIQASAVWVEEAHDWTLPDLKREKLSLPTMHQLNGQDEQQAKTSDQYAYDYEPEPDRYRLKLENSKYDGLNYFKTKRQAELLNDMRNNNVSLNNGPSLRNNYMDPLLKAKRK